MDHNEQNDFEFDLLLNGGSGEVQPAALDSHQGAVYKGFATVVGVYLFFFIESLLKFKFAKQAKVSKILHDSMSSKLIGQVISLFLI